MELYKSNTNLQEDYKKQNLLNRQFGEFTFKLSPNTSGRQIVKFSPPLPKKALVTINVQNESQNELDLKWNFGKITNEFFEIHIQNSDLINEMSGTINWAITSP